MPQTFVKAGELPRAYVIRKNRNVSEQSVIDYVAARAAPHKKLGAGVIFVESLPKNQTGKILRRELKAQVFKGSFGYWDPTSIQAKVHDILMVWYMYVSLLIICLIREPTRKRRSDCPFFSCYKFCFILWFYVICFISRRKLFKLKNLL